MNHGLTGKVAIVTGASSGIGRSSALKLAKEGVKVALVDLKDENAEKVKQEIEQIGGEAIVTDTDVSDMKRMEASFNEIIEKWGRLDIVFANAGINGKVEPIEDLSADDWDQTLNTNLKSTFLTVKLAIPYMKAQGGSVIITSSINGTRTFKSLVCQHIVHQKQDKSHLEKWQLLS